MTEVGSRESVTQDRVIKLFKEELGYDYLGDWQQREDNRNIEEELLKDNLLSRGYSEDQAKKAIKKLEDTARLTNNNSLYETNKATYQVLRYGANIQTAIGENRQDIQLIDWDNIDKNHFAIAEEVTVAGNNNKRPDVVIYVNGIALGVIELKRSTVSINEGVRQNIGNQDELFIRPFFTTVQFLFAGSDTEGLKYGTIDTPEKYYLNWKEDIEDTSRILLDKYLIKMCSKHRLLELIFDFIVYDGDKKLPRPHQYFGVKEAQKSTNQRESGIIWHTQGSGKSITMVFLAKWILENNPSARVVIITDRTELDKQIKSVFEDSGEQIERATSGKDLMDKLSSTTPRLLCSLVHKFGSRGEDDFSVFIESLKQNPPKTFGELFIFVDECHRTQNGRLHQAMKAILPGAVFTGFTGTPLLKEDKQTSQEIFGKYIHTYKFNEGVDDGVILDLIYEARDIDQKISSPDRIDEWFDAKTSGLNDYKKSMLKKKWANMQSITSSSSRMGKIVTDIICDFSVKPRLSSSKGNAMLVAKSIYEACRYFELFQRTELKGKCGIVTSYSPHTGDISNEDTGENTETHRQLIFNTYKELLKGKKTEDYEDDTKALFDSKPADMKLLIVVDKLLTGFDAPTCSYLYIDKSMQDHGLFQAICRVNRLDGDDKQYGYIVDYKELLKSLNDAFAVYTSELDSESFNNEDIGIKLKDRLKLGREKLDEALENLFSLCEPVKPPRETLNYIHYFCGNCEIEDALKATEVRRSTLYKMTGKLVSAYANIADEIQSLGYTQQQITKIKDDVSHYVKLRDEIKYASGETIDLKSYEAGMRYLIDTFVEAKDPKKISSFGNMSLVDLIVKSGLGEAINSLPEDIRNDQGAAAETIVNNVRRKIVREQIIDPAFYSKMSSLLEELVLERKQGALEYEEYLERIAEIARQASEGKTDETPDSLVTPAQRALYNNLEEDEALALRVDQAVKSSILDDFRGNLQKERKIKASIHKILNDEELVEKVFRIIYEQREY
jgi:type I restriction enzyme R subunit